MAVRNFWVELDIDGRMTQIVGGPRSRNGGFNLIVYMRNDGGIIQAVTLRGYVHASGELRLDGLSRRDEWSVSDGDLEFTIRTVR